MRTAGVVFLGVKTNHRGGGRGPPVTSHLFFLTTPMSSQRVLANSSIQARCDLTESLSPMAGSQATCFESNCPVFGADALPDGLSLVERATMPLYSRDGRGRPVVLRRQAARSIGTLLSRGTGRSGSSIN